MKNEYLLDQDDNIWNDKDSDDFLRYLKYEYFLLAYIGSMFATEIFTGFSNLYNIDLLGERHMRTTGTIFIILMVLRSTNLIKLFFKLKTACEDHDNYKQEL
jgi:hypothetical protein